MRSFNRRIITTILLSTVACGDETPTPVVDAGKTFAPHPATCETTEDCQGNSCSSVPESAATFFACEVPVVEATQSVNPQDECSSTADCTMGLKCFPIAECQGVSTTPVNRCVKDECTSDAECTAQPNGVCGFAGMFSYPVRQCIYGSCMTNSDCTDGQNGVCTMVLQSCGFEAKGLHCAYDHDECQSDGDCNLIGGETCAFFDAGGINICE